MFHSKPFKKDLTAFAKGGSVVKHVGKGASETTSGPPAAGNRYPKTPAAAPQGSLTPTSSVVPPSPVPPSPVPPGPQPASAPSAMMPPDIGAADDEA